MTGINPPVRAARHSKRSRRERHMSRHKQRLRNAVGAWVVCLVDKLSVVRLMRWLDSTPAPSSMQSGRGMWSSNVSGLGKETDSGSSSPENWRNCACRPCNLKCGRHIALEVVVMERRREMFRSGECPAELPLYLPSASFAGQQLGQGKP